MAKRKVSERDFLIEQCLYDAYCEREGVINEGFVDDFKANARAAGEWLKQDAKDSFRLRKKGEVQSNRKNAAASGKIKSYAGSLAKTMSDFKKSGGTLGRNISNIDDVINRLNLVSQGKLPRGVAGSNWAEPEQQNAYTSGAPSNTNTNSTVSSTKTTQSPASQPSKNTTTDNNGYFTTGASAPSPTKVNSTPRNTSSNISPASNVNSNQTVTDQQVEPAQQPQEEVGANNQQQTPTSSSETQNKPLSKRDIARKKRQEKIFRRKEKEAEKAKIERAKRIKKAGKAAAKAKKADTPAAPAEPAEPVKPTEPAAPATPTDSNTPDNSAAAEDAATPTAPAAATQPTSNDTNSTPAAPNSQTNSSVPPPTSNEVDEKPEIPANSEGKNEIVPSTGKTKESQPSFADIIFRDHPEHFRNNYSMSAGFPATDTVNMGMSNVADNAIRKATSKQDQLALGNESDKENNVEIIDPEPTPKSNPTPFFRGNKIVDAEIVDDTDKKSEDKPEEQAVPTQKEKPVEPKKLTDVEQGTEVSKPEKTIKPNPIKKAKPIAKPILKRSIADPSKTTILKKTKDGKVLIDRVPTKKESTDKPLGLPASEPAPEPAPEPASEPASERPLSQAEKVDPLRGEVPNHEYNLSPREKRHKHPRDANGNKIKVNPKKEARKAEQAAKSGKKSREKMTQQHGTRYEYEEVIKEHYNTRAQMSMLNSII